MINPTLTLHQSTTPDSSPIRASLRRCKRVVIKAGTSVVTGADGLPSLTRIGSITEQVSVLVGMGKEVIIVSSGAVGIGRKLLKKQLLYNTSLKSHASGATLPSSTIGNSKNYDSACAAAGQLGLMNIYNLMFDQRDMSASQILLTQYDFSDAVRIKNLGYCIDNLLALGIIPIINENDAVSANQGYTDDDMFSDNDSLASLCARLFNAEVLLLLTDVKGVYDRPPNEAGAKLLKFYNQAPKSAISSSSSYGIIIGAKSLQGRGGMSAKIDAAVNAVKPGSSCQACVIAAGFEMGTILSVLGEYDGQSKGTLFLTAGSELFEYAAREEGDGGNGGSSESSGNAYGTNGVVGDMCVKAREESRKLKLLSTEERKKLILDIAGAFGIEANVMSILEANKQDVKDALKANTLTPATIINALQLTPELLKTLVESIQSIANQDTVLDETTRRTLLSSNLNLTQLTVPIGVLLTAVDLSGSVADVVSLIMLCVSTSNALLIKCTSQELTRTYNVVCTVIQNCIEKSTKVRKEIIGLISNQQPLLNILKLDSSLVDLIIPRCASQVTTYIKENASLPLLGNVGGVCTVYVDSAANLDKCLKVVIDSVTTSPFAANKAGVILFHEDCIESNLAYACLKVLRQKGAKCFGGSRAIKEGLCDTPIGVGKEKEKVYAGVCVTVDIVSNVNDAIDIIHSNQTNHTTSIMTEDLTTANLYMAKTDAPCVLHNCSTLLSTAPIFGLGESVSFSTGKIHGRGPVGASGLVTTKYLLQSGECDLVAEFAEGGEGGKVFTHESLDY